jgi:putative tryptophan/tyrosine transport system substrate-binding protein
MDRRRFLLISLAGVLAAPLAAEVQQVAASAPRIGTLWPAPASAPTVMGVTEAFKQGLEQRGYVEGKTVAVEYKYAEQDQMPRTANDPVGLNVDIIVTGGTSDTVCAGVQRPTSCSNRLLRKT